MEGLSRKTEEKKENVLEQGNWWNDGEMAMTAKHVRGCSKYGFNDPEIGI